MELLDSLREGAMPSNTNANFANALVDGRRYKWNAQKES
jgi:hypothetical protein